MFFIMLVDFLSIELADLARPYSKIPIERLRWTEAVEDDELCRHKVAQKLVLKGDSEHVSLQRIE